MTFRFTTFAAALLLGAAAHAATVSTTLSVTATVTLGATLNANGTATLTNGIGSGTFVAAMSPGSNGDYSGPYTITLSSGDKITGNITASLSIITSNGTASATVSGGTGTYAGATGSFLNMPGSGAVVGTSVTLSFAGPGTITTGGVVGPTPPSISAVWDAASNTPILAQGTIFIVKGTSLCPSGTKFFDIPRPTVSSDGVKITFTPAGGGSATDALLWYEYNPSGTCQLAGILPSTVPVGNYNVTVTNGTVSAPVPAQVVKSKFALFTQDSSGTGLAVAQDIVTATHYDLNRLTSGTLNGTTIAPAHPGQPVVAYGSGMGPVVGSDNAASPLYDFHANGVSVRAIVGGMTIPVDYAGLAGYAGEDQINFTLPANVPTGCTVSLQISVDGTLSPPTFMAIAPSSGATECVQPGFTAAQLKGFDNGSTYTIGAFSLSQLSETVPSFGTVKLNSASGAFTKYTGFQLAGAAQYASTTSGACTVTHTTSGGSVSVGGSGTGLDAGSVTLDGPTASGISNRAFTEDATTSAYSMQLASEGIPGGGTGTIVAGKYTVAGAGGKDVGKFSTSITLGTPISLIGGLPTTINRSVGLPFTWTGGNASDIVEIIGGSSTTTGSGTSAITDNYAFVCTTTAGAGTFTVPSSVLQQLPAATVSASGSGGGFLEFASSVAPATFSAPLTAGGSIDNGAFLALLGIAGQVSIQ